MMRPHVENLVAALAGGPARPGQLIDRLGISQATLSRTVGAAGAGIVRIGAGKSIHYSARDNARGLPDMPVYRVSADGTLRRLGVLVPVRPAGFVMHQDDGVTLHTEGLPWWLNDMRPQGFLGRQWAARHGADLGLPPRLGDWMDTHALRALIERGDDVVGNLLLGDIVRDRFLHAPLPAQVARSDFPKLAARAESGDVPGSSAGGEQPKFAACVQGRHVIVKFSAKARNDMTERWRDLLVAEYHALSVLHEAGLGALAEVFDIGGRRFLEVERFDRVGERGRRAVHSLESLDAEFVGQAGEPWPRIARELARNNVVSEDAIRGIETLYAFGALIGNTDMHNGNLAFIAEHGRPYALAPAYDMLPMAFRPQGNGTLPSSLEPARLHPSVSAVAWKHARDLAAKFVTRVKRDRRMSAGWRQCIVAISRHLQDASEAIARLD